MFRKSCVHDYEAPQPNFKKNSSCHRCWLIAPIVIVAMVSLCLAVATLCLYHKRVEQEHTNLNCKRCIHFKGELPNSPNFLNIKVSTAKRPGNDDDGLRHCCLHPEDSERSNASRLKQMSSLLGGPQGDSPPFASSLDYRTTSDNSSKNNSSSSNTEKYLQDGTIPGDGRVSAHKALIINGPHRIIEKPEFVKKYVMLNVRPTIDPRHEHVRGVDIVPEGMKIKASGLYFVYSSIYFMPDSSHPCKNFESQTFQSKLMRNSSAAPPSDTGIDAHGIQQDRHPAECLLESLHTCCPNCAINRESSYSGGVFQLNEGDIIHVEICAFGLAYFSHDVSFVGLFMIGQQ